jgi:xanthine dehydrogenase accessory factor
VLIVGAGHVGVYLAPLITTLGFRVFLCDSRESFADASRLPPQTEVRVLCADHDDPEVRKALPQDLTSSVMFVMTHDHQLDQAAIEWALREGFGLVGGVGSRAKATRTRDRLASKGFSAEDIARIRMPLGVDIGARSPAEIGVAIAAELVAWRAALFAPKRSQKQRVAVVDPPNEET